MYVCMYVCTYVCNVCVVLLYVHRTMVASECSNVVLSDILLTLQVLCIALLCVSVCVYVCCVCNISGRLPPLHLQTNALAGSLCSN